MAQIYQNRKKNAESHLFGDEPPSEHYEILPETIQGLQDASNNRKKAMVSHVFDDNVPQPKMPETTEENRHKNLESHLSFQEANNNNNNNTQQNGQNQSQRQQSNQYQFQQQQVLQRNNNNNNSNHISYQLPQVQLRPKLQPLPPEPEHPTSKDNFSVNVQKIVGYGVGELNKDLSSIDDSIPSRSPRNFNANYNQPNFEYQQQMQQPQRLSLAPPQRPAFLDAPVHKTTLPSYDGLIQNAAIPNLAPFPNFDFECPPIENHFTFVVRPLTSTGNRYQKKLNFSTGNDMKRMRDELEKDAQQFEGRIKCIEKVEIQQPMRPVTAVEDDPPTLDFSFASPRLNTTQSDFVFLSTQELADHP